MLSKSQLITDIEAATDSTVIRVLESKLSALLRFEESVTRLYAELIRTRDELHVEPVDGEGVKLLTPLIERLRVEIDSCV